MKLLMESEATEDEILAEMESHDSYKLKYLNAKSSVNAVNAVGNGIGVQSNNKAHKFSSYA